VLPRWLAFATLVIRGMGDEGWGMRVNSAFKPHFSSPTPHPLLVTHAQPQQGTVDITVDVGPNVAHVEERYLLAPAAAPVSLRVLTRPCTKIGNLAVERAGSVLPVAESRAGPWLTFRDTTQGNGDSLRLLVRYDVQPAGAGVIPLVHLTSAVTRNGSARAGPVNVLVTISDTAARVAFPHMTRDAPNGWSAPFVAVPSFVEVAGLRAAPCDEGRGVGGDNGGLVWRFFLLVGIMITWVPLYLAWARRSSDREQT
jgi:hypothetical protein